jgi:dephospho-CoA kinase
VARVLVTGMSGTGKSSALEVLASRGHRVVDTDEDGWSRWTVDDDGASDWVWREDRVAALLDAHATGPLFVAGCRTNQGALYDRFEHVVVLVAPLERLLERLSTRTANPYGSTGAERALVRRDLREDEPRLRATATAVLDATTPLDDVAAALERLADEADR